MTLPPFGLSPTGFRPERLADITDEQNEAMRVQFGNINLAPQSVFGQLIGVQSKTYADLWENLENVYFSQYPNSASGVSLDNVVALNGVTRLPASQTKVFASCTGNEGTAIPVNALARIPNTNDFFQTFVGGTITAANTSDITIAVGTLAAQSYTVSLDGLPYFYSLPLLTFTGSFVTGNQTVVTLNGALLTTVPFNTDTNTTIDDIATEIALQTSVVFSATRVGTTIKIVPVSGKMVTINSVSITGGASQPTVANTFTAPATVAEVSSNIVAVINTGAVKWVATDLVGSFKITALLAQTPFATAVGVNLSITSLSSPIVFLSQVYGPVACPANSLTQIITPINGWIAVNNPQEGILGRNVETDAELRLRRLNSLFTGNATVEAIRSKIINVPGVVQGSVTVYENTTLTEQDIVITFSQALIAGQTINVTYDGASTITQAFTVDMATTMAALAAQFAALPAVATTVISGGNLILTIKMNLFLQLTIAFNGVNVTGAGSLPSVVTYGGLPPKSFEVVVVGGTSQDIGNAIWLAKPAGIQSFGDIQVSVLDSQGNTQFVHYTIPNQIYIWVTAVLTLDGTGTFPATGVQSVTNALYNYGISLATGETVYQQRMLAQVFSTPGIASAVVSLAGTISTTATPSYAVADVPIATNQRANFDKVRIAVTVV